MWLSYTARPARPVADGWQVVDDLGSVVVSTLTAPEPQTIVLTPAMSVCELRSEVAQRFGAPLALDVTVILAPYAPCICH